MPPRRRPDLGALAAALLVAALVAAAPGGARADLPAPAQGGALRISADPPRLVLGKDGAAELRIATAPDVEELAVLSASVGRVELVRRAAPGLFQARYRPPADRVPQVAIVAALARTAKGVQDGWLAIPLSGQGDARVRAEPGSAIALRIGEETFGPRTAGKDGVAVIPVVVPPGVREAHHGFTPVDLHVPEMPLLHAVADRGAVHADRTEVVRVLAYVVAPHGVARRGDVPVLEPSRGAVQLAQREPGAFEASWTLPPGAAGEDRLVARLPGQPASRVALRLDAIAGPPALVAVAFDREVLVAGAAEPVRVTARVLDAAGNPVAAEVELEADGGRVTRGGEAGPGAVAARLDVPPRFGDRRQVVVTARVPAAGISGSRVLPLAPGPAAAARIVPASTSVLGDGAHETALRVAVVDAHENDVADPPVVAATRGTILALERDPRGGWQVRYRAPSVAITGEDRVVATAGEHAAETALLLVPPRTRVSASASAGAAGDLRGRFAGPRLGLAAELPAPGALPAAAPASLSVAWRFEADLLGWDRDARVAGPPRGGGGTVSLAARGGALLVGPALHRTARRAEVWASAGVGALVARADRADGAAETGAGPAARLALGAALPRGAVAPFLELSLLAAGESPAGAFAAAGLSAGVTFEPGGLRWRRSSSSTTSP